MTLGFRELVTVVEVGSGTITTVYTGEQEGAKSVSP